MPTTQNFEVIKGGGGFGVKYGYPVVVAPSPFCC